MIYMPLINTLFSHFIYSDVLDISDQTNEMLKSEVEKIIKPGTLTNFHEDSKSILSNPTFLPFFNILKEHINIFTQTIQFKRPIKLHNAWVTITHPGACHNFHTHGPETMISGVYYIEASEELSLIFVNNNLRLSPNEHVEPLKSKKLVLFDGSLVHGFVPVTGNRPKITIAFNMVLDI